MISDKIRTVQGRDGARRAAGIPCLGTVQGAHSMPSLPINSPDPEVPEKAIHRRFTAKHKLQVLRPADVCREKREIGALLRRAGLYSSHLTPWRRQRDAGIFSDLKRKQRGRKANPVHPLHAEVEQLRKENNRLQSRLKKAELIIDIQKKFHTCWGSRWKHPGRERTIDESL